MGAESVRLYKEFLEHYDLQDGNYNHAIEFLDHPLQQVEKVQAIRIGETLVPLSPAVQNSVKFNVQLNLAPINAEKEIKQHIGMYKGCILDDEDVNLFCYTVEDMVLRNLLWPFHLMTEGAELRENHFFPIAHMMEGIVCDVQDALHDFYWAVIDSTGKIDAKRDREIEFKNRQTDNWAANAPIEVRGSIRRNGKYLDVYATTRSTVTSGMVNAEYQVHSLLENQFANREKATTQINLLNTLEGILLGIIKSYKKQWYDCLKGLTGIIGRNLLRDSIVGGNPVYRPDQKENMIEIINNAEGDVSYGNLAQLIKYYGHDYDDMFGHSIVRRILNQCVKDKKIDTDDFDYDFYAYYYEVEHPLQHEPLFNRLREYFRESVKNLCVFVKENHPDDYTPDNISHVLKTASETIELFIGITNRQRFRLDDDCYEIFYDILGDNKMRDYYKNGSPRFEY